jgi:hypothetical protein
MVWVRQEVGMCMKWEARMWMRQEVKMWMRAGGQDVDEAGCKNVQ